MNYFIDTEFVEGTQKKLFGKITKPTIDLISIGIVADDGREYYAISKEFNVREAWNRYDLRQDKSLKDGGKTYKYYWLRENVLRPIFNELSNRYMVETEPVADSKIYSRLQSELFNPSSLRTLLELYGKTNKQIADDILRFTTSEAIEKRYHDALLDKPLLESLIMPTFYGYYADYDWVVFCWLFGKMNNLPSYYPMYCRDLKQMIDEKAEGFAKAKHCNPDQVLKELKSSSTYPKEVNVHNALGDARWTKQLFDFISTI